MIKKERGAITLFTVVICMFLLTNVLLINVGVMNRNASQEKEIAKISENYEVSQAKMEQAYQEAIESNEYPTYGQLLKLLEQAKDEAQKEAQDLIDQAKEDMNKKIQEEKLKEYPVGSLYISTNSTNPNEFIGGTWERYGKGQTLVGLDENQTEFNTVGKTGGQKNITLNESQLPTHSHSIPALSGSTSAAGKHTHTYSKSATATGGTALTIQQIPSHTHTVTPSIKVDSTFVGKQVDTEEAGKHTHNYTVNIGAALSWPIASDGKLHEGYTNGAWGSSTSGTWNAGCTIKEAGNHIHKVTAEGTIKNTITAQASTTSATGALNGTTQSHTHTISLTNTNTSEVAEHTHTVTTDANTTGATGSGESINVQNPYITVYMWRRIS